MRTGSHVASVLVFVGVMMVGPAVLAQDCPELVGRWPYGLAWAVAASEDYVYFGSGTALLVADVSDPAALQVVGEVVLPGVVWSVAVSGSYAYVANDHAGLRVVDLSTPSNPT